MATVTLKPSGGDYNTFAAFVTGEAGDLVTATNQLTLECYKGDYSGSGGGTDTPSDALNLASGSWTVNGTYFVKITVPSTERHTGIPKTGFYISAHTGGAGGSCIRSDLNYSQFEYLDGHNTTSASGRRTYSVSGDDVILLGCIGKADDTTDEAFSLTGGSSGAELVAANCLAYECANHGFHVSGYTVVYNCTSVNNADTGFLGSGTLPVFKNCLASGNTTADFGAITTNAATYCASSDATADDSTTDNTGARINQTFTFVATASDDWHLASGDTGAIGYGTDLSADGTYAFSIDVDEETRSSWDIGFDEYVAAPGGANYLNSKLSLLGVGI